MTRSTVVGMAIIALVPSFVVPSGCSSVDPAAHDLLAPPAASASNSTPAASASSCPNCPQATCTDGIRNGSEVGVDCGGSMCTALGRRCAVGNECRVGDDCGSTSCQNGTCQEPTCADGVRNGIETDVDCGAGCGQNRTCPVGKSCGSNSDCTGGVCNGHTCAAPTCSDGFKNQDETDIDCGGQTCPGRCSHAPAQTCRVASDCISRFCETGTLKCGAPTCKDGAMNGDETDVDCGGGCAASQLCLENQHCHNATDCQAGVCLAGVCAAPSCSDAVQNGQESDVDCGGSCAKCAKAHKCKGDADCDSAFCGGTPLACVDAWSGAVSFYPINSIVGYQRIIYVALIDIVGNNPGWPPPIVPDLWKPLL